MTGTGLGAAPSSSREELIRKLGSYLDNVAALIASPRHQFASLLKNQVPETSGLYAIYQDEPFEVLYVGKAEKRGKESAWSVCDGLRFRIMENHLGVRGDDNLFRYIKAAYSFSSKPETRAYIRSRCSVQWLEVNEARRLFVAEHLAIAALQPRFNRG